MTFNAIISNKSVVRSAFVVALVVASLNAVSFRAYAGCVDDLSSTQVLDRSTVMQDAKVRLQETLGLTTKHLSQSEFEILAQQFLKARLDKGHDSWRSGYQSNKIKALLKANPEATDEEKAMAAATPNPKPLPKGKETEELIKTLQALSEQDLAAYMKTHRLTGSLEIGSLKQDINSDPKNIFPALHKKLNGVHEKYAQVLVNYVRSRVFESGSNFEQVQVADILGLSHTIHEIWMQDASWKVQPILAKFGIVEAQFYALSIQEIVTKCEKYSNLNGVFTSEEIRTMHGLTQAEFLSLKQFTDYQNLSEADKILDDKILSELLEALYAMIAYIPVQK